MMVEARAILDVQGALRSLLEKIEREGGGNPRVHPNGFIQLDLTATDKSWDQSKKRGHSGSRVRLHIWNPPDVELPHQGTVNEVHDHVFDMSSTVLLGTLTQRLYRFVIGSMDAAEARSHELYRAIYDKNSSSRLEASGVVGKLECYSEFDIPSRQGENSRYTQPAFTLHDSYVHPSVGAVMTLMEKTEIHVGDASVVCPIGVPPDNNFDRAKAMSPEEIWVGIWNTMTLA